MRVIIECPRCGQENARVSQHCWACGEWLHGASPVTGVCPRCQMPVRESMLVCANCGLHLHPSPETERPLRLPEERRLAARARKVVVRPARASARVFTAAFLCRAAGIALLLVAAVRGLAAAQEFKTAAMPDEALLSYYAVVLWSVVGIAGIVLLVIGLVVLRPGA